MNPELDLFSLEQMPEYPRYQAYISDVAKKFPGNPMMGSRAGVIVHYGVITRRMMRLHGAVSDFTPAMVEFSIDGLGGMIMSMIQFSMLGRYQNELFNAMEEAFKIFREEEDQYGKQQMMLQEFQPTTPPN